MHEYIFVERCKDYAHSEIGADTCISCSGRGDQLYLVYYAGRRGVSTCNKVTVTDILLCELFCSKKAKMFMLDLLYITLIQRKLTTVS